MAVAPKRTDAVLEALIAEVADIKAKQQAMNEVNLLALDLAMTALNLLSTSISQSLPDLQKNVFAVKYVEFYEQYLQSYKNEIADRVEQALGEEPPQDRIH